MSFADTIRSIPAARVPKDWRKGVHAGRSFPRQCYTTTLQYVLQHSQIPEIHYVVGMGFSLVAFEHAWVELPGGIVFDGVAQHFAQHDDYYRHLLAQPMYRFTPEETVQLSGGGRNEHGWQFGQRMPLIDLTGYNLFLEQQGC